MSYVITTSICRVGSIAQFYVRETKLRDLCHTSWRRSPLALPESCRVGDPQTREQLYQRSSCTVAKVLGPTTDFPTWGPGKGPENPQGIWLWRSVGFDDRNSTGLGKQRLLEDTNKILWASGPRRRGQWSSQETEPDLHMSVRKSLGEAWVNNGLPRG